MYDLCWYFGIFAQMEKNNYSFINLKFIIDGYDALLLLVHGELTCKFVCHCYLPLKVSKSKTQGTNGVSHAVDVEYSFVIFQACWGWNNMKSVRANGRPINIHVDDWDHWMWTRSLRTLFVRQNWLEMFIGGCLVVCQAVDDTMTKSTIYKKLCNIKNSDFLRVFFQWTFQSTYFK